MPASPLAHSWGKLPTLFLTCSLLRMMHVPLLYVWLTPVCFAARVPDAPCPDTIRSFAYFARFPSNYFRSYI